MELVIHRDKLESSTEREREKERGKGKEGVEQKGEKCLEGETRKTKRGQIHREMWYRNVKSKKGQINHG